MKLVRVRCLGICLKTNGETMIKFIPVRVKRSRLFGRSYCYMLFARNAPRAFSQFKGA